jgi:hypothetical protein
MERILTGKAFYSKRDSLKLVKVGNWESFYFDEDSKEKWIVEYPYGYMHAGGPPQLRKLEKFPWEESLFIRMKQTMKQILLHQYIRFRVFTGM